MDRRAFLKHAAAASFSGLAPKLSSRQVSRDSVASDGAPASREFFYRPQDGYVGDVIPFYSGGRWRVFYLHRINGTSVTSWYQASTTDFVRFVNHGEMISPGSEQDQDLSVATGSVVESDGRFHIFYTGYSSVFKAHGRPEQGILHAISDDLMTWTKVPHSNFNAPLDRFERDDWRDPFVFWNKEANEYWMLIAARLRTGSARRRGCTALCASRDLDRWEVRQPFWVPGLYMTHECPDLFRMGDWWYLIFSEFSEGLQTRYRMSRSIHGPWLTPDLDTFDTRALYAAKSCSDGQRRMLLGWNPTRAARKDEGNWEWGGNLAVHQLHQERDGSLSVHVPDSVARVFTISEPVRIEPAIGNVRTSGAEVVVEAPDTFAVARCGSIPVPSKITATVRFAPKTRSCGLVLHMGADPDRCYYVRLEPERGRVVFDRWPRPGDVTFMTGMERPVSLEPRQPVNLTVFVDDTIGEIYVNDHVAMSTRMYDFHGGSWGIFAEEGSAAFRDLSCFSIGT